MSLISAATSEVGRAAEEVAKEIRLIAQDLGENIHSTQEMSL